MKIGGAELLQGLHLQGPSAVLTHVHCHAITSSACALREPYEGAVGQIMKGM